MKLMSFSKKKAVAFGLAFGVAAGAGGIAAAYFSNSGSGTGHATIGSLSPLTVTANGEISGALFPNNTTPSGGTPSSFPTFTPGANPNNSAVGFTIHNGTIHSQTITGATASVAQTGGGTILTANGSSVGTCKASWFTAAVGEYAGDAAPLIGQTLSPTGSVTVAVNVHMATVTATQNACAGHSPKITLSVSSKSA